MTPGLSDPQKTRQVVLLVWIALLASVGADFLVTRVIQPPPPSADSRLWAMLFGASIASLFGSLYFRSRFGVREGQPRPLVMVRAAYIVCFAFCELPALLGLVAFFIVNVQPTTWFFVLSIVAFAVNFPGSGDFDPVNR